MQIVAAAKTALPECMEQLNDIGQQLVEDYANDLIKIPEYRRSDAPATPPEGTDTTPAAPPPESAEDGG